MNATTVPGDAVRGLTIAKSAMVGCGGSSMSVETVSLGLVRRVGTIGCRYFTGLSGISLLAMCLESVVRFSYMGLSNMCIDNQPRASVFFSKGQRNWSRKPVGKLFVSLSVAW